MAVEFYLKADEKFVTSGTSITLNCGLTLNGQLMIAIIVKDDDPAIVLPTGGTWTIIQEGTGADPQCYFSVAYRIKQQGDASWTWTGDNEAYYGVILSYKGQASTGFIHASGKADGDSTTPTAPSVSYTDLEAGSLALHCFGQDYDRIPYTSPDDLIERYSGDATGCGGAGGEKGTIIDSYNKSNYYTYRGLNNLTIKFSQSFTATADTLGFVKFYIQKVGSPTGNVVAKLYTHSGTYGSSSIPDTLLATSDIRSLADMPVDLALVTFTFSGVNKYSLTSGTKYCITIESDDCDADNKLNIGQDSTSPTHSGNPAYCNTSFVWSPDNTRDLIFYVLSANVVISGSGSTGTAVFTTAVADEWLAVTVVIEAEPSAGVVELAGEVQASASTDGALVFTWGLVGEVSAVGQTISLLKKFQQYIFPFSYDDKEWVLTDAQITGGVLDITASMGNGRRVPDSVWYSGSTDDFEIEADFKQDNTGAVGARISVELLDGVGSIIDFEVHGGSQLMRIVQGGQIRASQAFADDTNWHTMKVRRVGTTYYMSIDAGDEISWDYGIEYPIEYIYLTMAGITGDFDNFKYKWEDACILRGAVIGLSQTDGILEIFKSLAGIIEAQSQTDGNIVSIWGLLGDINAQSQTDASLLRIFSILGEVAGQSQTDGNIVATWSLAGAVDALAQTLGDITIGGLIEIVGAVAAQSQIEGNLVSIWSLLGTVDSVSQIDGNIIANWALLGDIDALSQTDGSLAILRDLIGSVEVQSQIDGLLKKEFGITGVVNALSQTDGQLAVLRNLVGAIDAISQTDGTLLRIYSLSGVVDALSQIDGIIAMTRGLSGTVTAESQTIADLFIVIIKYLKGQIEAQSQTGGFLVIDRTLVGAINALSQVDGAINMITYVELQGAIAAISDLLSDLDVR